MSEAKTAQPAMAISPTGLRELLDRKPDTRMLDVRTGAEYQSVHIPGSYNVPLDALSSHLVELAEGDNPLVVICQSGGRAGQACQRLTDSGDRSFLLLEGGMQAWQSAGGQVYTGTSNKWAMDRQVRFAAGSLIMMFAALSIVVPLARWLATAVGVGLFYSAVSNTCAMGNLLARLPYNRSTDGDEVDVAKAVAGLT